MCVKFFFDRQAVHYSIIIMTSLILPSLLFCNTTGLTISQLYNYYYNVCRRSMGYIITCYYYDNHRSDSLDQEYVLPSVELTLKNLQIDYLDLYLIHVPFAFRRGTNFNSVQEEDKYGYVEEKIATAWKVSGSVSVYTCVNCVKCQLCQVSTVLTVSAVSTLSPIITVSTLNCVNCVNCVYT